MKIGDLVTWSQGHLDIPGLILDVRSAKSSTHTSSINPVGLAVLAVLPELDNDPEWFHEYELEVISECRTSNVTQGRDN